MTTRTRQELVALVFLLVIAMAVATVVDADWPHHLAAAIHAFALGVQEAGATENPTSP